MSTPTMRAALERLLNAVDVYDATGMDVLDDAIATARAALAAEPVGEGPSAADLLPVEPPNIQTTMAMQYRSAWREGVEDGWNEARSILARWARPAAPPALEATHDLSDAAPLLWLLWGHLGGQSPIGQPIRKYLGMGQFERMSDAQIEAAKQYVDCETCQGVGTIDERLGGLATDNPAATCPDCDGVGEARRFHRPAAPAAPEAQRDAVIAAVTEALGGAYDCLRVWEAWGIGTMGQDDFALVAEDGDRVAEIADAAIEAMRPAAPEAPEAGEGPSVEQMYYWALKAIRQYGSDHGGADVRVAEMVRRAQEALDYGTPAAPPTPLPPDYIDPEHQGDDRELLETFYGAGIAEGGTVDEVTLRGLRAVLATRPAIPPAHTAQPIQEDSNA